LSYIRVVQKTRTLRNYLSTALILFCAFLPVCVPNFSLMDQYSEFAQEVAILCLCGLWLNSILTNVPTVLWPSGFCPGQPRWDGTRKKITHSHLSWSSVILYLLPPSMIHVILPVCAVNTQLCGTFCGTWYLSHSQVHNYKLLLSINKHYVAYFSLCMHEMAIFLFSVLQNFTIFSSNNSCVKTSTSSVPIFDIDTADVSYVRPCWNLLNMQGSCWPGKSWNWTDQGIFRKFHLCRW